MNYRQEREDLDELVATVVATTPKLTKAVIEARDVSRVVSVRRERLADAIREAELLAAYLRDRQRRLGWHDDRSDAA